MDCEIDARRVLVGYVTKYTGFTMIRLQEGEGWSQR
jgi:hypothetical protein